MSSSPCCIRLCRERKVSVKAGYAEALPNAYLIVILASCKEVESTDRTPKNTSKDVPTWEFFFCGSDSLTLNPEHFWQTHTHCFRSALSKDINCLLINMAKSASASLRSSLGSSRVITFRFFDPLSSLSISSITWSLSRLRLLTRIVRF